MFCFTLVRAEKVNGSGPKIENPQWLHYVKRIGQEKFIVQFPGDPKLNVEAEDTLQLSVENALGSYILKVQKKDDYLISKIMGVKISRYPFEMLFTIPQNEKPSIRGKVIITDENIYYLICKTNLKNSPLIEKFTDSFMLIG